MKFGIGMEIEPDCTKSAHALQSHVNGIAKFLELSDYGSGVEHFTIGLVAIKSRPGYEEWFKQRKPRHKKEQNIKMPDGSTLTLKNTYSYDIKLSNEEIESFAKSSENAIEIFNTKFFASLANFESPSMKKRDFDLAKFTSDIGHYLKQTENA